MTSPTPFEETQTDLNPHRAEDVERAAEVAYSQLRQRGVTVDGSEDPDALATLLSSVERFEDAVSAMGGDRMTNAPDTNDPDSERLVLPVRADDEALDAYTARIDDAADALGQ